MLSGKPERSRSSQGKIYDRRRRRTVGGEYRVRSARGRASILMAFIAIAAVRVAAVIVTVVVVAAIVVAAVVVETVVVATVVVSMQLLLA